MTPEQVAASYDRIAERWLDVSTYGFAQIERAVAFVKRKGVALDVGCGTGRCFGLLTGVRAAVRREGWPAEHAVLPYWTCTGNGCSVLRKSATNCVDLLALIPHP